LWDNEHLYDVILGTMNYTQWNIGYIIQQLQQPAAELSKRALHYRLPHP